MCVMAQPSPLAQYLSYRLHERHESADEFARRIGVNASGFYRLLRGGHAAPQQRTLEKIAAGLGMTASELLAVVEAQDETDPVERTIRQRTGEMREALNGIPRQFWGTVIKATFDRAIDEARDMARLLLLAEPPVSDAVEPPISAADAPQKRGKRGHEGELPLRKLVAPALALGH
jgi:transcriptional regulator with XRE-family HTH domain